jgi:hypothetical protein
LYEVGDVGYVTSVQMISFFFSFQRGFVEAHSDDGLVEIFGLKEGWHASFVMAELIKAKHIAQVLAFVYCPISALMFSQRN